MAERQHQTSGVNIPAFDSHLPSPRQSLRSIMIPNVYFVVCPSVISSTVVTVIPHYYLVLSADSSKVALSLPSFSVYKLDPGVL